MSNQPYLLRSLVLQVISTSCHFKCTAVKPIALIGALAVLHYDYTLFACKPMFHTAKRVSDNYLRVELGAYSTDSTTRLIFLLGKQCCMTRTKLIVGWAYLHIALFGVILRPILVLRMIYCYGLGKGRRLQMLTVFC